MRPSATAVVRIRSFSLGPRVRRRWVRWGEEPRWRRISLRAWRCGGVRELPSLSVMATRNLFRRRARAVRVGPRDDPRFVGQPEGSLGFCAEGSERLASWTAMISCRELGAPDM